MNILLDTSMLLYFAEGSLPKGAEKLIKKDENTVYFSIISLWEIMIKTLASKLEFNYPLEAYENDLRIRGYKILELKLGHICALSLLNTMHRDPFDRLLVAQAIDEKLIFFTSDQKIMDFSNKHGLQLGFESAFYCRTTENMSTEE